MGPPGYVGSLQLCDAGKVVNRPLNIVQKTTALTGHIPVDFGNLIWVLPSFWCKEDFLLFILDEYCVSVCRS